jgi:hypothetical protein
MTEHLIRAFEGQHQQVLDLLDDHAMLPENWSVPTHAEPALLRSLPENSILVVHDEKDRRRVQALLTRIRDRSFRVRMLTIDEYMEERAAPGRRAPRVFVNHTAMLGVLGRHREQLANVAHRGTQMIAGLRATLVAEGEKRGVAPDALDEATPVSPTREPSSLEEPTRLNAANIGES